MHSQYAHYVIPSLQPEQLVCTFADVLLYYFWIHLAMVISDHVCMFCTITDIYSCFMAGIMALSVTSSYYEMTEIATRILPNIVVLTFDPARYNL